MSAKEYQQLNLFAELGLSEGPAEPPPPVDKRSALADLARECAACTRCGLHVGRTNSVFADGNPEAQIMLIGEGPGRNEDEQGIPFVGKAGQLLDKILQSVGFDRKKDIFISNIVKCRPENNRAPTKEEMDACLPYLMQQIELVKPQIIILAGATALKGLLRDPRSITKVRGHWIEWQGIWVMPIFHPAFLLRNDSREVGSPKWLTWQDAKAIYQKYEELRAEAAAGA